LKGKTIPEPWTAAENAWSPLVLKCNQGTERRNWLDDQRLQIYWGKHPCRALKTKSNILKSTRKLTSSQCRETSTGVICAYFLVPVNNLAAAFCTNYSRSKDDLGKPK